MTGKACPKHGRELCEDCSVDAAEERIRLLEGQVGELQGQLRKAQAVITVAVELGEINPHDDPRCPQDDTCECSVAKSINEALAGYKPTAANLDRSLFPTAREMRIHRAVEEFSGVCRAHKLNDCRTCAEKAGAP